MNQDKQQFKTASNETFHMRCDTVTYRQGFIEVIGGIHDGLVNVETWKVSAEIDITGLFPRSERLTDSDFSNTELELTPTQARNLAAALVAAADAEDSKHA